MAKATPRVFVIPTFEFGKNGKIKEGVDYVMKEGDDYRTFRPQFTSSKKSYK